MQSKALAIGATFIVVALAAFYFLSPLLALRSLALAAKEGDKDALSLYVDFPSVRSGFKDQFNAFLAKKAMNDQSLKDNPFAGFAMMLVPMIVDRAVDSFITPDGLATILKRPAENTGGAQDGISPNLWRGHFSVIDLDRLKVTYLVDNDNPKPLSLMLERRGLFGWKLTRIDLPLNDIEDAASSKPSVKPSNNNETAIPDQSAEFPKIADVAGDVLPTEVKQCGETNVKRVGNRLEDGNGTPVADSGSAIEYTNGGSQVSYDQIPGIDNSKSGDQIRICLTSIPQHCPPGDSRGRIYHAINHRTGEEWDAPDAEHSCGGA